MREAIFNHDTGKGLLSDCYNKVKKPLTNFQISRFGKSENHPVYKYVTIRTLCNEVRYTACIPLGALKISQWTCTFNSDKEAAIAVDKKLIEFGRAPVNILKRKV